MTYTDSHEITSRLVELAEQLSVPCHQDYDPSMEELEREFAEIRLQLGISR